MNAMYSFIKSLKKAEQTRRYSIQSTESGWEVREEQDAEILRHSFYHDWHRVERARLALSLKFNALQEQGWHEV